MSPVNILEYTFEKGLREPNYVNGRLLTAEDLSEQQATTNARLTDLGQAIGTGIIDGLQVSRVGTAVRIAVGKALNRNGQLVELHEEISLSLQIENIVTEADNAGSYFAPCDTTTGSSQSVISEGAYLLAIAPVSRTEESVPTANLGRGETAACARKWIIAGAEFKAIRLTGFEDNGEVDLDPMSARVGVVGSLSLRNRLAQWCLGHLPLGVYPNNTYDGAFSGLDRIGGDLTDCDVPLAVFYWQGSTPNQAANILFVDNWSARRDVVQKHLPSKWRGFYGDVRWSRAVARSQQFQEHLETLLGTSGVASRQVQAIQRFPHLPPVGYIPLIPPFEIWRRAVSDFVSIFLSMGTTKRLASFLEVVGLGDLARDEDGDGEQDNDESVTSVAATLYEVLLSQRREYGLSVSNFFGRLPRNFYYSPLQYIDIQIRYILPFDALIVEQEPSIRLYYPEEYLIMEVARMLLQATPQSNIDAEANEEVARTVVNTHFTHLRRDAFASNPTISVNPAFVATADSTNDALTRITSLLALAASIILERIDFAPQSNWNEQIRYTLRRYLRMPASVVTTQLARNDLLQACFVWEIDEGERVNLEDGV